jgi:putative membrane protein
MYGYGSDGGTSIVMILFMGFLGLLFIGAVLTFIWWGMMAMRRSMHRGQEGGMMEHRMMGPGMMMGMRGHEDPIEILKMRYAKGEITKEEFDKMKKDLS